MAYSHRDQIMLTEAYSLQLLKESIPGMSLKQVNSNLDLMTESELEYVSVVSERILNEFWGGLKNLASAGKNAGGSAAGAVGQAGSSIGQGIKNAAGAVGNVAKGIGKGAVAAGKQVVDNTKDIYNKGVVDKQAGDSVVKAQQSIQQLIDLITQAQENDILSKNFDPYQTSLSQIIDYLEGAKKSAGINSQQSLSKGFTGGAGQAFRQGMQS